MNKTVVQAKNEEELVENKVEPKFPRRTVNPRVDIFETKDSIVIRANMPGVTEENVNVTLEKDLLTIDGEVLYDQMDGYKQVYGEQRIRNYRRRFTLTDKVDRDAIEAKLNNGVLTLVLSKTPIAKARRITVQPAN